MSSLKSKFKLLFSKNSKISNLITFMYNHLPFNNLVKKKKGNKIKCYGIMKKCKFSFNGKNNLCIIEKGAVLRKCQFIISGSNNTIIIKKNCRAKFAEFCQQDNDNLIQIDENTTFAGKIHLACIEGTKIIIGNDCLFSSDIVLRTGDSHVILDLDGNRINPSKDINIGNHVWIGHRVLINKGVATGNDMVIGTGAILTKSILDDNCIVAGVPGKIVKNNTNWSAER